MQKIPTETNSFRMDDVQIGSKCSHDRSAPRCSWLSEPDYVDKVTELEMVDY